MKFYLYFSKLDYFKIQYQLYTALGVNLVLSAPPKDQQLSILNEVWKVVTKLTDPKEYITVAEVYIEYPLKHCTVTFFLFERST